MIKIRNFRPPSSGILMQIYPKITDVFLVVDYLDSAKRMHTQRMLLVPRDVFMTAVRLQDKPVGRPS